MDGGLPSRSRRGGGELTLARAADEACARIARGAELLLLLDLDGTLATFKVDPARVRLYPGMKALLARFVAQPRTRVLIVTGRRASEAHAVVGLDRVGVVGLHGREFLEDGRARILAASPRARRALDRLLVIVKAIAARTPGSHFEDKRPGGVVLHTRGAPPGKAAAAEAELALAIAAAGADGIELLTGKRMAEARVGGASKGTAVADLAKSATGAARRARRPAPVILFAGDDVTDEDAHRALAKFDAITILVAARARPTAARFRVPSIGALKAVLERLAC